MTTIKIFRNNGHIEAVTVSGHTGYAEEGSDIICAAVSALTQGALLGVRIVAEINAESKVGDGLLSFRLPSYNDRSDAILESMVLSLRDIAQEYRRYVKMEE